MNPCHPSIDPPCGPLSLSPSWTKVQIFRCDSCTEEFFFVFFFWSYVCRRLTNLWACMLLMVGPWDPADSHSSLDLVCVPSEAFIWPDPELHLLKYYIYKYMYLLFLCLLYDVLRITGHDIMLSFLFAVPSGTHHPSTHPSMHPPTQHCVCKGVGFPFWHSGFIKHDGSFKPKLFAPWSGCTWFLWFCSKLILFLGVHHQTCSIQSTSWWILGLVESSLCFGYALFWLLNYLVDGCPCMCALSLKFLWQATWRYLLKPTKFRHPKNTGCTQPEVDIVTTDKVLLSLLQTSCSTTVLCVGKNAKNQWICTQLLLQLAMWYMQSLIFTLEEKSHMKKKHGEYAPLLSSYG